MAGFGQNIEEIVLSIQTKGQGDLEALKQTLVGVMEKMDGLWGSVARGEDVVKNMREINGLARDVKLLETAINGLDPSYRKWIRNADEAGRAVAESFRKQAEAAKEALEAERRVAAEKDRLLSEDIARTLLASQKKDAIAAQQAAEADEALSRDIARTMLAAQRKEAIAKEAYEHMQKYGYGRDDPFWSKGKIEGTYEQARAYGLMQDRMTVLNKEFDRGHDTAKKFSYGLLNVAHAFQDAQYGMGAVLNNIPLVVQAFGGGPGLAGTIMIAGVVIEQTLPKIKQIARELGMIRDPAIESARSIETMKEKINALIEKPWKVDVDYRSIEKAKAELTRLESRLAAYNAALSKQTPMQEKIGKGVLEAVSQFAGEEGEAGGTANLGRIVGELSKIGGDASMLNIEMNRRPEIHRARLLRDEAARNEALVRSGAVPAEEAAALRRQGVENLAEASSLEAKARSEAAARLTADLIGAPLKGNQELLGKLIALLGTGEAQQLMKGNVGLGIKPVSPQFMERLQAARPGAIAQREEDEQHAALVDQEFDEKMASMRAFSQKWRAARDKEVSDLVSGGKAKALEGTLQEEVLALVKEGADRQEVYEKLIRRAEALMGEGEVGKLAAKKLLRQVTERAFAGVIGAKDELPAGATDAMAVAKIMADREEAAKEKADKAAAKRLVNPVTGKPYSPKEHAAAKALDKQLDEAERLNAQQRKVRRAVEKEDKDAGKMDEAMQLEYASRYAMQNYNLNQGQADVAAKRFLKLREEGVDPFLAEQQAIQELAERNQRMFNPRGRRGGGGFRSIAPIDEEGGGGNGGGNGGGLPMAMGAVGAMAQVTDGVVRDQMMFARVQASTMLSLNTVMANQRAMRQQLPTLLASPMPPTPR